MSEMREQITQVFSSYQTVKEEKDRLVIITDGLEKEIKRLSDEKLIIDASWESLRHLLEEFSSESISLLQEMLLKGVRAIFNDRNYGIEVKITDKKKKSMEIWLIENRNGILVKSEVPGGVGGSITVVISFLFRVFLINLYKKRPFLLLDESFTQISTSYLPNFMNFLLYLHKEMGFNFLWITQDQRLHDYFNRIYEVKMGEVNKKS